MDIRVTFKTPEHRSAFATRWKLDIAEDVDHIDVPWHLAHHAIKEDGADEFTQLDSEIHDFIVKGDKSVIEALATIKEEMGSGWFLVTSDKGLELGKLVDSIEITDTPITLLSNVSSIEGVNGDPTDLDPTSPDGQWARIRVASSYRPLAPSFSVHEVKYGSKPELYIVDSGINFDHNEFDYEGLEKVDFYTLPRFNGEYRDDVGHGTAVASLAVGKNLGVARYARLMNVKMGRMVNGERDMATLVELGYVIDAIMAEVAKDPTKPRIVNMSFNIARSAWLDSKVQALLDAGVTVVCAAGNQGISVENVSPAGLDSVITVGAIDKYDIPAGFNNISPSDSGLTTSDGLSLDIFAPGDNVMVADSTGNGKYMIVSGTSVASPLVAGVAVEIASMNEQAIYYNQMKDIILNTATKNALLFEDDRFSDNQNRLVFLATSDPLAAYKTNEFVSYLGVHNEDDTIVADLNSNLNVTPFESSFPDDKFTYSIELAPDSVEYAPFFSCDPVTGIVTITKPDLDLPEEVRLKMVNFVGVAESSRVKLTTNTIFFFVSNSLYKDTLESDITLALTDVNSVSFFAFWGNPLK